MRALPMLTLLAAWLIAGPLMAGTPTLGKAPDHVLIWTLDPGAASRALTRLGFVVRPGGQFPDGVANSTVMFADQTYLELLHFARPELATDEKAKAALAFVAMGPGADSFAFQVPSVEAAAGSLTAAGFQVGDLDPEIFDPDGPEGPRPSQPADWRDFHFRTSPVTGAEVFFIQYPPDQPRNAAQQQRFSARTTHPNSARRLTEVWLLVRDVDAEADAYVRMGLEAGPAGSSPRFGAKTRSIQAGDGRIILLEADGVGVAADRMARRGPQILGVTIAVNDMAQAERLVRAAYPGASGIEDHPDGPTLLAPTDVDLGLFIAFRPSQDR